MAVLPQFVLFEMAHVLRNLYALPPNTAAALLGDIMELPGVRIITAYPWKQIFEYWSDALPSIADAAIVAIALSNGYDAVATFDHKLSIHMKSRGVAAYWAGS